MINGNVGEFVDRIYSCQDTIFIFDGIKYWFQGYTLPNGTVHMEVSQYHPISDSFFWEYDGKSIDECHKAFLKAPIFAGQTFWEVEKNITWVDE